MRSKITWIALSIIITLALVLTSCAQTATTTITTTTTTTVPATTAPTTTAAPSNWWDKFGTPQYGGTLTVRTSFVHIGSFDPAAGMAGGGGFASNIWGEGLAFVDWTLDRSVWSYPCGFTPLQYLKGLVAEKWEQTDPSTITLTIRQGIKWHNKAPTNGRELVADDVAYNFDRLLGTGHGFTTPNPMMAQQISAIEKIVVTGTYTLQFQLKQPGVVGLYQLLGMMYTLAAPEFIELGGPPSTSEAPGPPTASPLSDWKNVVGTGPRMLTDFVENTSMTFSRNPDYWGYDERYPKNKLPYAAEVVQLAIPDSATALAALRSGKIDMWTDAMGCLTWQQEASLKNTNPDINQFMQPRPGGVLMLRCDTAPFTDINVRKALQMAVDRATIAQGHYGGYSDGKPCGIIGPSIKGWSAAYDTWPQATKDEYAYNVEGAKKLLEEAGLPAGFKTNAVASSNQDTELLQILQAQFKDINVTLDINVMDPPTFSAFTAAGKQDQMVFSDGMAGLLWAPTQTLAYLVSASIPQTNNTFNYDNAYDALVDKVNAALTAADMEKASAAADLYAIQHHWMITVLPSNTQGVAWQPWVKGYSGEILVDSSWAGNVRARVWIDQSLKK